MQRTDPSPTAMVVTAMAALTLGGCSVFGGKAAEEVPYQVLRSDNSFELRQYPPILIAETSVSGSYGESGGTAFRRLFNYISGDNRAEQEIAMTAPVFREAEPQAGQEIAMTAPVFQQAAPDGWTMAFVLPEGYTLENAPAPTNPEVILRTLAGEKRAVIRFTGIVDEEDIDAQAERLRAWIEQQELEATGGPRLAGYNPPWTIPFLRRNEVLIPVR